MFYFYKKVTVFLLPFLLILIFLPVKKRSQYIGLEKDCANRGIWLHDRLFENETPIDIAFVGSSHTMNAIKDEYLSETWQKSVTNLGYCRLGRNMSYWISKEALKHHSIEVLVVEVREGEDRQSHEVFPLMADTRTVFSATPFFNGDLLSDYYQHISYKLELTQEAIFQETKKVPIREELYGFGSVLDTADFQELKQHKESQEHQKSLTTFSRNYFMTFARTYIQKITTLCNRQQTKLYFLYLPSYGAASKRPLEYDFYQKYGQVIIPPSVILDNPNYWRDKGHLNEHGAKALSEWLPTAINLQ